jgi:hypothetical protein
MQLEGRRDQTLRSLNVDVEAKTKGWNEELRIVTAPKNWLTSACFGVNLA